MKYRNRFVIVLFSILMLGGVFAFAGAADVSAQQRTVTRVIYRPVYIRRPFLYSRYYYDPFYDPYYYDPYLRAQRDKYYADGILTPKEQEQMASDQEQLAKALRDARRYTTRY